MSRFTMNVSQVATTFIETMLPRFSGEHVGLNLKLGVTYRFFDENEDDDIVETADLHVMAVRPANYTKIYQSIQAGPPFPDAEKIPASQWDLVADHDSGWRSGIENALLDADALLRQTFDDRGIPATKVSRDIRFGISRPVRRMHIELQEPSLSAASSRDSLLIVHGPETGPKPETTDATAPTMR